jgi:hypothetical protein
MPVEPWDESGRVWEEDHGLLDAEQVARCRRADVAESLRSPVPTRMISNGEYMPAPQTDAQKRVEALTGAGLSDVVGMSTASLGEARSSARALRHPNHGASPLQRQLSEKRKNGNIGHHGGGVWRSGRCLSSVDTRAGALARVGVVGPTRATRHYCLRLRLGSHAIGPNSTQLADQCSLCPTQLVRRVGPIESSCDGSPTRLTAVISELVDVYAERPRPVAKSGADGGRESARTRPEVIAPRSSAGTSLYPEVQENRGHHDGSTAHWPEAPSDADHRPVGSLISGPLDAASIERFKRGDDAPTEPAAKVHQPPGDPSRRPHRIEGRSPSPLTRTAIIGIAHVRPVESR